MRLSAPLFVLTAAVANWAFGPEDCVTLGKSGAGTCVIKTHCRNVDTSTFEFAFVCTSADGSKVKHTYGEGGFEAEEDYDTDVQCESCDPPPGVTAHAPGHAPAAKAPSTVAESRSTLQKFAAAEARTQSLPPASAAFYGPNGCVATYRCPEGTCIMQTRCKPAEVSAYNFGLTCVDSAGDTTRHLFGLGSFDSVETFDTLIECRLCLGLDGEQLPGSNVTTPNSLSQDVAILKQEMKDLQEGVREIKESLGLGKGAAAATTAAPAATTAAAANTSATTAAPAATTAAPAATTAAPAATTAAPAVTTAAPEAQAALATGRDASADGDESDEASDTADEAAADDTSADSGDAPESRDGDDEPEQTTGFLRHGRHPRQRRTRRRHRRKRRPRLQEDEEDDLDALMADALD